MTKEKLGEHMKISVCVCSYNGEQYIAEQLNSIINQTILVDEIVFSDDNSADKTVEIAQNILEKSGIEHKIIVNNPNLGVTKNFEQACLQTTGDIIFFSDQDDIWMPNKVERLVKEFENNPSAQLVFSDAVLFDENREYKYSCWDSFNFDINNKVYKKSQIDFILNRWFVTGATMAVRRELFEKCLPFGQKILHDQILSFVASYQNACLAVDEKLIKYRQHVGQVVGAKKLSNFELMKSKGDDLGEIEKLQELKSYFLDQEILNKIDDKCDYYLKRIEIKKRNKVVRFFLCLKLLPKYKKYHYSPLKKFLKDVIV